MVEEDRTQGFVVRAQENIPAFTLICEYTGEVDISRNHVLGKKKEEKFWIVF
jgi:hypothetical protein